MHNHELSTRSAFTKNYYSMLPCTEVALHFNCISVYAVLLHLLSAEQSGSDVVTGMYELV
jgi:hypothetical protein